MLRHLVFAIGLLALLAGASEPLETDQAGFAQASPTRIHTAGAHDYRPTKLAHILLSTSDDPHLGEGAFTRNSAWMAARTKTVA